MELEKTYGDGRDIDALRVQEKVWSALNKRGFRCSCENIFIVGKRLTAVIDYLDGNAVLSTAKVEIPLDCKDPAQALVDIFVKGTEE